MEKNNGKSLEQEFAEAVISHKITIIKVGLNAYAEKGIYDHELLEEFKDLQIEDSYEKASIVEKTLYEEQKKYHTDRYDKVYELCWNKIKRHIPNSTLFE